VDGLRARKSKGVGLIVRAISFQDCQFYVVLIHQRHRRTDRRTDRRTTCNRNTALCTPGNKFSQRLRVCVLSQYVLFCWQIGPCRPSFQGPKH